jgi:hypothetical protein
MEAIARAVFEHGTHGGWSAATPPQLVDVATLALSPHHARQTVDTTSLRAAVGARLGNLCRDVAATVDCVHVPLSAPQAIRRLAVVLCVNTFRTVPQISASLIAINHPLSDLVTTVEFVDVTTEANRIVSLLTPDARVVFTALFANLLNATRVTTGIEGNQLVLNADLGVGRLATLVNALACAAAMFALVDNLAFLAAAI